MEALLGFELNFRDHVTFASLFILGAAFITALVLVAGLPELCRPGTLNAGCRTARDRCLSTA